MSAAPDPRSKLVGCGSRSRSATIEQGDEPPLLPDPDDEPPLPPDPDDELSLPDESVDGPGGLPGVCGVVTGGVVGDAVVVAVVAAEDVVNRTQKLTALLKYSAGGLVNV
ncbi:hypothetical protein TGDOM2_400790 [Toxoplasma gondii GAB2-2007-GAL-DOM2]|uniref:Uncharacterized protein n=1 Tax=Toxoplasma gondii GAB2-2007-GAL-DOM2 TaxID=1130820 RepID=A0A086JLG0_TOXGO|nr:hypothetical protein TGDOM2_400790 [Toxoplasma gondii GAB2-2007-GAL-DOM2]